MKTIKYDLISYSFDIENYDTHKLLVTFLSEEGESQTGMGWRFSRFHDTDTHSCAHRRTFTHTMFTTSQVITPKDQRRLLPALFYFTHFVC